MGKAAAVVSMDGKPVEPKDPVAKKKRERIELIETPPRPDWFVETKDERGRPLWFLRLSITGMLTRRYGPFASRHKALLFLDTALDALGDAIVTDLEDRAQKRSIRHPYEYFQGWFIEHPSLVAHQKKAKAGAA